MFKLLEAGMIAHKNITRVVTHFVHKIIEVKSWYHTLILNSVQNVLEILEASGKTHIQEYHTNSAHFVHNKHSAVQNN